MQLSVVYVCRKFALERQKHVHIYFTMHGLLEELSYVGIDIENGSEYKSETGKKRRGSARRTHGQNSLKLFFLGSNASQYCVCASRALVLTHAVY